MANLNSKPMSITPNMAQFTMHITIPKRVIFRLRVGLWFIRLGVWITGMGCDVKGIDDD
jgi:hypothetical protein